MFATGSGECERCSTHVPQSAAFASFREPSPLAVAGRGCLLVCLSVGLAVVCLCARYGRSRALTAHLWALTYVAGAVLLLRRGRLPLRVCACDSAHGFADTKTHARTRARTHPPTPHAWPRTHTAEHAEHVRPKPALAEQCASGGAALPHALHRLAYRGPGSAHEQPAAPDRPALRAYGKAVAFPQCLRPVSRTGAEPRVRRQRRRRPRRSAGPTRR